MNPITNEYTLGFYDSEGVFTVYAKQKDTERQLTFRLVDNLGSYIIDNNVVVIFRETFSTGQKLLPQVIQPTISEDGDAISFQLTSQMLAVNGIANCEIAFIDGLDSDISFDEDGNITNSNYQQLTSRTFKLYIEPSVHGDSSSFVNPDTNLEELVITTKAYLDEASATATEMLNTLQGMIDAAVPTFEINPETGNLEYRWE